jgi:hypothetical protein
MEPGKIVDDAAGGSSSGTAPTVPRPHQPKQHLRPTRKCGLTPYLACGGVMGMVIMTMVVWSSVRLELRLCRS